MEFYAPQLFHIYNQGNNRHKLFFSDAHYEFFLWKMRAHLQPFGHLIAYCLMPNHYHWLFYVEQPTVVRKDLWAHLDKIEWKRRQHEYGQDAKPVEPSNRPGKADSLVPLNDAIGMLQKAYTRAINTEKGWSGSLFRKSFKAKDGWIDEFITLYKPDGNLDYRFLPGTSYALTCFSYIHDNAKEAGLVVNNTDWPYSSAREYASLRRGSLCNVELGKKLLDL